jgi:hypothetical protein
VPPRSSTVSNVLAQNRLGAGSVASFALTAAAPIMVVGGVVTTAWSVTGTVAVSTTLVGMAGLPSATPDTLQRRFIETSGKIIYKDDRITARLDRRTYSPVLRQSTIPETITVPWWGNRELHFEYT